MTRRRLRPARCREQPHPAEQQKRGLQLFHSGTPQRIALHKSCSTIEPQYLRFGGPVRQLRQRTYRTQARLRMEQKTEMASREAALYREPDTAAPPTPLQPVTNCPQPCGGGVGVLPRVASGKTPTPPPQGCGQFVTGCKGVGGAAVSGSR